MNTRSITAQSLHWRPGFGPLSSVGGLVGHYGVQIRGGIEPDITRCSNLLMARDFWSNGLIPQQLKRRGKSPQVLSREPRYISVLETASRVFVRRHSSLRLYAVDGRLRDACKAAHPPRLRLQPVHSMIPIHKGHTERVCPCGVMVWNEITV